jgi:hypothetical protein
MLFSAIHTAPGVFTEVKIILVGRVNADAINSLKYNYRE